MYPPKPNEYYSSPGQAMPPPPMAAAAPNQYYPSAPNAFPATHGPQLWSTGLCGCTDDCGNCCLTCFCPCITFGRIAEIVDQGATSCGASGALYALLEYFTCCHWIYSCFYRSKMRAQLNLAERPCNDCLVHCCCEACALCQEYRELQSRGFDMTIGWHANMARRAQGMAVPPVIQGGMMR